MAKGMGNGFPIGGLLSSSEFKASHGLLGTTFGGNYLACAAALAVLEIIEDQKLVENAREIGSYLIRELSKIDGIAEIRGRGLMIGLQFDQSVAEIRKNLVAQKRIFTGVSSTNIIRLLPPLTLTKPMADEFIKALKEILQA
jgi:acetylornithine aminotransferase